jgi:hypothetical protein
MISKIGVPIDTATIQKEPAIRVPNNHLMPSEILLRQEDILSVF